MFDIPEVLKSDNRPHFNSEHLRSFATHREVIPYWPRAECFIGNLGKVVKAASSDGKPWKQELNKFLRNYRATPHTTTNTSPFTALFGSELKMKLPALYRPNTSDLIRDADDIAKARMKLCRQSLSCQAVYICEGCCTSEAT